MTSKYIRAFSAAANAVNAGTSRGVTSASQGLGRIERMKPVFSISGYKILSATSFEKDHNVTLCSMYKVNSTESNSFDGSDKLLREYLSSAQSTLIHNVTRHPKFPNFSEDDLLKIEPNFNISLHEYANQVHEGSVHVVSFIDIEKV